MVRRLQPQGVVTVAAAATEKHVPKDPNTLKRGSRTDSPPVPSGTDRDAAGRFQRGNEVARRHGLYAGSMAATLVAERRAFETRSVVDDGGDSEVPTRRRSLHFYRARLHVHIEQLSGALEQFGLFDGRGRLRANWLQRLEGLMARAQAIDATLGLDRRQRRVPSLHEVLESNDA